MATIDTMRAELAAGRAYRDAYRAFVVQRDKHYGDVYPTWLRVQAQEVAGLHREWQAVRAEAGLKVRPMDDEVTEVLG